MDYATQLHYTHGIPKTNEVVGERISLAFRVKPPRHGSESMSRRSAELRIFARDRRGRSCVLPSSQWNTDAKTLGNPRVRGWQPRCTTRAHADQGLRRHAN